MWVFASSCEKKRYKEISEASFQRQQLWGLQDILLIRNDGYAGQSQRKISKVIMEDENLQKFSISFTSKAIPRPVSIKETHDRHQIGSTW